MSLQTTQATRQYHEAGKPLAGALRLASLHVTAGDERPLTALLATCLAHHGHAPGWNELRALAHCARSLRPRSFARAEAVVLQGTRTEALYIVHAGAVRVDGADEEAGPLTVHGAWGVFSETPCRHTVVTVRTSILLELPKRAADRLIKESPASARLLCGGRARQITDAVWPKVSSVSAG